MKGSSRWLIFTAMSFLVTGTALAAKKVEAAPAAAPQAKSWIDFSEKKEAAPADSKITRLEPMTKDEEEALKKFVRSLEKTIATVQGAKLAADTTSVTAQASQVKLLQSLNTLRAVPSASDIQMVRDVQGLQGLTQKPVEVFVPPVNAAAVETRKS